MECKVLFFLEVFYPQFLFSVSDLILVSICGVLKYFFFVV